MRINEIHNSVHQYPARILVLSLTACNSPGHTFPCHKHYFRCHRSLAVEADKAALATMADQEYTHGL